MAVSWLWAFQRGSKGRGNVTQPSTILEGASSNTCLRLMTPRHSMVCSGRVSFVVGKHFEELGCVIVERKIGQEGVECSGEGSGGGMGEAGEGLVVLGRRVAESCVNWGLLDHDEMKWRYSLFIYNLADGARFTRRALPNRLRMRSR